MAALPHESVGSFSHKPLGLLEDSLRRGLRCFPIVQSGHDGLHGTADVGCATTVWRLNRAHRVERVAHWKSTVARLWEHKPSVEYRWLIGDTPARGSFPVLSSAVLQCTTVEEVNHAVQD